MPRLHKLGKSTLLRIVRFRSNLFGTDFDYVTDTRCTTNTTNIQGQGVKDQGHTVTYQQ